MPSALNSRKAIATSSIAFLLMFSTPSLAHAEEHPPAPAPSSSSAPSDNHEETAEKTGDVTQSPTLDAITLIGAGGILAYSFGASMYKRFKKTD